MPNITILNTGKMRSGKDTVKDLLIEMLPEYNFKPMALARKVKEHAAQIVTELWGWEVTPEMFDNPETKNDLRQYAIMIGQHGRLIDEDLWIDILKKDAKDNNIIVTDVRFENELVKLQQTENDNDIVISIRVKASDETRIRRGAQPEFFTNPSETGLNNVPDSTFDFVIDNDVDDWDNLTQQVKKVATYIKEYMRYLPTPSWSEAATSRDF